MLGEIVPIKCLINITKKLVLVNSNQLNANFTLFSNCQTISYYYYVW